MGNHYRHGNGKIKNIVKKTTYEKFKERSATFL